MFGSVAGLGTNVSSNTSKFSGIGGLVSGINTDDLIKKLTATAQAKIDSAYQQKQRIQWKQSTYQDFINSINTLKNSFFDVASPSTNLSSSSAFNTWAVSSSSSAVTVSSSTTNTGERLDIKSIDHLAVAQSLESGTAVSGGIVGVGGENALNGKQMMVTLDGVTKTIDFGDDPQDALNKAFGMAAGSTEETPIPRISITHTDTNGDSIKDTFKIAGSGTSKVTISGDADMLASIGLKSGQSTHVDIAKTLGNTSFATALVGGSFAFTINGVDFNFSSSDSVMKVINTINSSEAGVKIAYSDIDDKFTMTSTTSGTGNNITVSQLKGNLLSAMFGISTSEVNEIESPVTYATRMVAKGEFMLPQSGWAGLSDKSFDITVNGVTKTIKMPTIDPAEEDPAVQYQAMVDSFNSQLKSAFGNSDVQFKTNPGSTTVSFELEIKNNKRVTLNTVDDEGEAAELLNALKFDKGTSNTLPENPTLSLLGLGSGTLTLGVKDVNQVPISYDPGDSISVLLEKINNQKDITGITATFADGKLSLKSDGSSNHPLAFSDDGGLAKAFMGVSSFSPNATQNVKETAGQNAVITLADGTRIERNTNSFNVNGINLQLNDTYTHTNDTTPPITISSTQNLDEIVKTVQSFVDEYNKIVTAVKGKLNEETNADYPPLTEDQRKDMSESQIKLWEDKSKSGIVKNDQLLNEMLNDFYDVLVSKSPNSPYTLEDIGISMTVSITDGAKLGLNEEKFREMLNQDHEGVTRLFTDPEEGVSDKFAGAIDKYGSPSVLTTGLLVEISGTAGHSDSDQAQQLSDLDERIAELKDKLTAEETRLWKQFSAMETALSQLNAQSSWLTSQLGG